MPRLLIIDPHPIFRIGLRSLLQESGGDWTIAESAAAEDALSLLTVECCDLVLLDRSLPGVDGLDVLKRLREGAPEVPVIVLSPHRDGEAAVRAIRAGAAGFLCKDCAPDVVLAAIRRVLGGQSYIDDWLGEQLVMRTRQDDRPRHTRLSDREFQVLLMIASGMTAKAIGMELGLSVKTVSTYRSRLLEKLDLGSNAELAIYAVRHGLLSDRNPDPGH